ncbi:hypothetical protein Tco_0311588 [Tanacetum coccineum]
MEAIQAFLKKYDHIPPREKSMALLLAEERFLKIKQALEEEQNQPENIQEFLLKLINDLQILNGIPLKQEEQAAKITIPMNEINSQIPPSIAITPVLPTLEPEDSLIIGDEHLRTIPEKESDEFIKSSVEDLVPIPITPLSDSNEDEFFAPGDDIEFLLHRDPSTPTISVCFYKASLAPSDTWEATLAILSTLIGGRDVERDQRLRLDGLESLGYDELNVGCLIMIKDYDNEKIDIRFRREYEDMIDELKSKFNGMSIEINKKKELQRLEDIISKLPPSIAITPVLLTLEPEDFLVMGNEELSTIPEKESDEVIKSSVEDFVPILSESEDTSKSDSECILPSCDDFSPINIYEEKSVTFSNPLFDSNDDFTSSDDESLSDEDVPEDNVKIYSNPLFEFDDEYISSDVNPLFDEVLENIESKDSYVSNLDEPVLLVTPLFKFNEDECFDPENDDLFDLKYKMNEWKKILYDAPIDDLMTKDKFFDPRGDIDEIDAFLDVDISTDIEDGYHDSKGDILYLESLLSNDTILSLPPEVFLDHDPWSLSGINDLKIMVKVFDPGIHEKKFSPTYVSLTFEDRHYLSFTYVIHIFLPYFTYPVVSPFLLSTGIEDIIFDPGISAFHFSSLKPVAYKFPMEVCSSTCFVPNITMIWEESS